MSEKNYLISFIAKCRRRLNLSLALEYAAFGALIGAAAGAALEIAAFLVPFYYADRYAAGCVAIGMVTGLIVAMTKRRSMEAAALAIDRFGFKERVTTAYENRAKEDELSELQRKNAAAVLRKNEEKIRLPIVRKPKQLGLLAAALVLLVTLALIPSAMKSKAELLHEVAQEAEKKEEEVAEQIRELEEMDTSGLTEEQLAALQEMIDSLKASMAELQQADSKEALASAAEKLDFKYDHMANELQSMAEALKNQPNASLTADALKNLASQMSENANTQLAQGENGTGEGSSQGNGTGEGSSQGNGTGEGSSQGNGTGEGSSQGNGNGQGSGNGSGGAGDGRGEGSSNATHDYISVPNKVGSDENLTGNAGDSSESQFEYTQNGLTWEGEHVSYESVIGSYTDHAYEGISSGKYPSGMEDVIKDYFGSFND